VDDLAALLRRRGDPIRQIYSSPRRRAWETALRLAEVLKVPVAVASALDEMDLGYVEGRQPAALTAREAELWQHYLKDIYLHPIPGGEAFRQLEQRVLRFAQGLSLDAGPVLLVSHTGPLLALLCHALGLDPRARGRLLLETASLSAVTLDPPRCLFFNEKASLRDG
jgi:broad specificity phosphatase PhoE